MSGPGGDGRLRVRRPHAQRAWLPVTRRHIDFVRVGTTSCPVGRRPATGQPAATG